MAHLTVKYNRKEDSTRKLRKITHNYPTSSFSGQSKAKQTVTPKGPGSVGDQELTADGPSPHKARLWPPGKGPAVGEGRAAGRSTLKLKQQQQPQNRKSCP